jgi:hypothetical protein
MRSHLILLLTALLLTPLAVLHSIEPPQNLTEVPKATKDAPFVNTLGMRFVPVPIGAGPTSGQRVLLGVWDAPVLKAPVSVPYLTLQMPHVSWNTALKRWLMVYSSGVAFCAATSQDGIHFGKPIEIMPLPAFNMKPGDIFTAYPTLVSPDKATQMVTGEEGFLYFARGQWGTNHTAWRRSFKITVGSDSVTPQLRSPF